MKYVLINPIGDLKPGTVFDDSLFNITQLQNGGAVFIPIDAIPNIESQVLSSYQGGNNLEAYFSVIANTCKSFYIENGKFILKSISHAAGIATRVVATTFEGGLFEVPAPSRVSSLTLYLTSYSLLGLGIKFGIYQSDSGKADEPVYKLLASGIQTPSVIGAQEITLNFNKSVYLKQGTAVILFGRSTFSSGAVLRVWTTGTTELLSTQVPTGFAPITFTTSISSNTSNPPETLLLSDMIASTLNLTPIGRFS